MAKQDIESEVTGNVWKVLKGAGADIRIASPDIKMSIMEIKCGLVPDTSITQTLRDLMPMDVAKELTFTGRILNGEQAKEAGLIGTGNRVEAVKANFEKRAPVFTPAATGAAR